VRAVVERLFEQALERLNRAPQLALPLTTLCTALS
jgi:hypothetical protein